MVRCFVCGFSWSIVAFDCYNRSISGTFTTAARTVNLDSIRYNSGQFSIAPGTGIITVSQDMTVQIVFRITTDVSGGTTRSVSKGYLELKRIIDTYRKSPITKNKALFFKR